MLQLMKNFLNGLSIGIIQIIPGISGATIAVVLGFYFELIDIINHFTRDIKKSLIFIIPFLLGMICGVLAFASLIHFLMTNYSFPTMFFFIGLIAGIIPHVYAKINQQGKRLSIRVMLMVLIPFVLLVTLSFLGSGRPLVNPGEHTLGFPFMIYIFIAGILAAAALIIPAVSGSFILLIMGLYPLAIYTIDQMRVYLTDISNIALLPNIFKVALPLGMGILAGIIITARIIEKLLHKHHTMLYALILGLILGSICLLVREPIVYQSGITAGFIIIGIITFCTGSVLSYIAGRKRL